MNEETNGNRESPPDDFQPLRGGSLRLAENMDASLAIPTATSYRAIPVKLLEENRRIINDHVTATGRARISYTHIIAWAVISALREFPAAPHPAEPAARPQLPRHRPARKRQPGSGFAQGAHRGAGDNPERGLRMTPAPFPIGEREAEPSPGGTEESSRG
jgi:hypothetical protein